MKVLFIILSFWSMVAVANGTYDLAMNEGCESGKNVSGDTWHPYTKDVDKYVQDAYYKAGWDDSFNKCKGAGLQRCWFLHYPFNKEQYRKGWR